MICTQKCRNTRLVFVAPLLKLLNDDPALLLGVGCVVCHLLYHIGDNLLSPLFPFPAIRDGIVEKLR